VVDGIEFGYRKDLDGICARYPVEQRFAYLASTVSDLIDDSFGGKITL
jgi:hypothetical protein